MGKQYLFINIAILHTAEFAKCDEMRTILCYRGPRV